jgi:hypothetical protein
MASPGCRCSALLCALLVLACAPAARADWVQSFNVPGSYSVDVPAGVTRIHVVAVGGHGGGLLGGFGAVVSSDVLVLDATRFAITVGGNGAVGAGGFNGGGSPGFADALSLGGGGGGASSLFPCTTTDPSSCRQSIIAAGGGGAGADAGFAPGGAGGGAGAAGAPGSSTATVTAAQGGGAGSVLGGGQGGGGADASASTSCDSGGAGANGSVPGGAGGSGTDPSGAGAGGGGGGGFRGGGGGGAGAYCAAGTESGTSGAGGGGGATRMPHSGQLTLDTSGQPSVTVTATLNPPTIAIQTPPDGATYAQHQVVRAQYTCSPADPGDIVDSCLGDVVPGARIDTSTLGPHTFTVNASTDTGATTAASTAYTVEDRTPPAITRLRIDPRRLAVGIHGVIRLHLSERSRVALVVERAVPGTRRGARCAARRRCTRFLRVGVLRHRGRAGTNRYRFDGRIGRRALAPGAYRLRVVASDAAGNRSRPRSVRFVIAG